VALFTGRLAAIEFLEGWVLVKRFKVLPPEQHGDFNTNLQCYVRDNFIELETWDS